MNANYSQQWEDGTGSVKALRDMAPRAVPATPCSPTGSSLPGLWKTPSHRNVDRPLTADKYMASRRDDDGAEGLWRVHDKLYDLEDFAARHPGGEHWLRRTKGTDVTELFETHHIFGRAEQVLPQFYVRDAVEPRNSPYTFHDDGFFRIFKRNALPVLASTPDTGYTRNVNDALVLTSLILAVLSATFRSFAVATLASLFICFVATCSHNFTHMKSNWRQYYLSLAFLSLSEWRVSHIFSHHHYPNTLMDMEISMHEPILQFLPSANKTLQQRIGSCLCFPLYAASAFASQLTFRLLHLHWEDLLPLTYVAAMWLLTGCPLLVVLLLWAYMWLASSFFFNLIGLSVAHHHPDIFHDGDAPREDRDWGLGQLDAVRDRQETVYSRFLVHTTFGDHALHHLFPTVDACRLPALYPVLNDTLRELGIEYRFTSSWELFKGMFRQLARNKPNLHPPSAVIGCGVGH